MPERRATASRRVDDRALERRRRCSGASAGASSLWSGGTTLVVLIVLGSALYAALATTRGHRRWPTRGADGELGRHRVQGQPPGPAPVPDRTSDPRPASRSAARPRGRSRSSSTARQGGPGPENRSSPRWRRRAASSAMRSADRPAGGSKGRGELSDVDDVPVGSSPSASRRPAAHRPGRPGPPLSCAARRAARRALRRRARRRRRVASASGDVYAGRALVADPRVARAASASSRPTPATSCARR